MKATVKFTEAVEVLPTLSVAFTVKIFEPIEEVSTVAGALQFPMPEPLSTQLKLDATT